MSNKQTIDEKPRIIAFGEILWDMLPAGPRLGGAPVNFLYHAHITGAEVQALTRIGNDQLGRDITARLAELNIPTDFIQISQRLPTGVVDVTLDENGSPTYKIARNVAWDEVFVDEQVVDKTLRFLSDSTKSAFYFGSLALRASFNRYSFETIVAKLPSDVLRVFDLNIRPPFYSKESIQFALDFTDFFKLNDTEALFLDSLFKDEIDPILSPLADKDAGLVESLQNNKVETDRILTRWAEEWRRRFGLKAIVLTCGAHGAYLFNEGRVSYVPSIQTTVADTVGAGDSFAAVCVVGLLNNVDDQKIMEAASKRAAYVCSHIGATPSIPEEETNPFKE